MKKKVKILLMALMLCAVFGGCANMGKEEEQLLIKRTTYNENDEMTGWTEYEYDEEGNVIRENCYDENGEKWLENIFDENENKWHMTNNEYEYEEVKFYDEEERIKQREIYDEGELTCLDEYEYDKENGGIKKTYTYEEGNKEQSYENKYIYNTEGNVLSMYVYYFNKSEKNLNYWIEYSYNTLGDCIEERRFDVDGKILDVTRYEYIYDAMSNITELRKIYNDFSGDIGQWYKKSYDEWGNEVEHITYDSDRNADYVRYVNEYKTITVDKEKAAVKGERKSVKNSDKGKLEFMKKLKDCMENKNYEAISEVLETRDTMWNTIYFQNNQLVDELADGEALIYSYGSGVYYGQVVNGKRQGQGVQWKDDTRHLEIDENHYYYIDGEWRDNKGNGYCKIYYSYFWRDGDKGFACIEGKYKDSLENGVMNITWMNSNQEICTGSYTACEGKVEPVKETEENLIYVWVTDSGGTGSGIVGLMEGHGFPRKIYDQID